MLPTGIAVPILDKLVNLLLAGHGAMSGLGESNWVCGSKGGLAHREGSNEFVGGQGEEFDKIAAADELVK